MHRGYIKLWRKITEWEWWDDPNTFRVFIYLLLQANHQDGNWRGIKVKRGQHVSSINKISVATRLSTKNVRTSINHLISTNEVAKDSPTKQWTIYTITRFEDYQPTKEVAKGGQRSGKGVATNNNDKNEKNEKRRKKSERKNSIAFGDEKVIFLLEDEHKKLATRFGERNVDKFIENMQNWKLQSAANMNKYTNDYRALLNWTSRAKEDGKLKISWDSFREEDFDTPEEYQEIINKYS